MKYSPCQECTERHEKCHGECIRYKLFDINNKKRLAERQAEIKAQPPKTKYHFHPNHKNGSSGWAHAGNLNAKTRERARLKKGWRHLDEVRNKRSRDDEE